MAILFNRGGVPDGAGAGRAAPALGAARATTRLLLAGPHALGSTLVLPWGVRLLPARTWSRGSPSTSPSSTTLQVPLWRHDPGCLLPRPCRLDPVVSWLSGPGPGTEPRGADPGPASWRIPIAWCVHLCCAAVSISSAGRGAAAQEQAEAASRSRTEQGICRPAWRAGTIYEGWALAMQGPGRGGIAADPPGHGRLSSHRGRAGTPVSILPCSPRRMGTARTDRRRAAGAGGGAAIVEQNGGRWWEAELLSAQGAVAAAAAVRQRTRRLKPASIRPSTLPATNKPNPWSCGLPPAWLASGSSRGNATKPMSYWHRSTAGSPKALIRPTCRTPRRCWTN